jgi:hypothetical protein
MWFGISIFIGKIVILNEAQRSEESLFFQKEGFFATAQNDSFSPSL